MSKETRVYNKTIKINEKDVLNFWIKRAKTDGIRAVLLGNQNSEKEKLLLNNQEKTLLESFLKSAAINSEKYSILDIGCGMGRWAQNFTNQIQSYTGIDITSDFIIKNKEKFKACKNINFYTMSIENIDNKILCKKYDCVIITGVLMYINDNILESIFNAISTIDTTSIYLQESISTEKARLSLNNFYSDELSCYYSAIYRTKDEYEYYIKKFLNKFTIKHTDILLKQKKETSPIYWFLEKITN